MARREPSWDELRSFQAVLRDRSLSGAARRLGMTQPTLGRHIESLEEALGVALFTRSPRGLTPTGAALSIASYVDDMAAASAALVRAASHEIAPDQGVVRVTASEVIGCEVLPPLLASFRAANPGVVIELALNNRNEDLSRRDADIAVRMVRPTQNNLVAQRIGETRIGLFAHRSYLDAFGAPTNPEDLKAHRLIGYDQDDRSFRAAGALDTRILWEGFGFRCDSDLAQLAALRAGVGIGGCQENIAKRDPDLLRLLADSVALSLEVWLVMHEDVRATPRIRLLFDHLARGLTEFVNGR
jgi:DNA-binding transcriptional LysR family regulator